MRQRYPERTGQPDRTAEVASQGEGGVDSGMYSGVDSGEDYGVDSGMGSGWILGMIMGWILGNAAFLVCETGPRNVHINERKLLAQKGRLGPKCGFKFGRGRFGLGRTSLRIVSRRHLRLGTQSLVLLKIASTDCCAQIAYTKHT